MKPMIAPSLLSSDFLNLGRDIEMINRSEADFLHLDIMDGVFVPNISFGFPVIERIRKAAKKPLDIHLMITEPDRYIERFVKTGAAMLSVHYEACIHLHRTVGAIKQAGAKAGVAINPHTPVEMLSAIIQDLDFVLVMSVNPGFGGQKFIETSYDKIRMLKELIIRKNSSALIEVDGGVDTGNADRLSDCGADILVAGYSIFSTEDPAATIRQLKQ
jgi:ribulose-phosphate 3-epimerase